jgi:3-oxoacyl-[acyl-carrier-protein] synthase II
VVEVVVTGIGLVTPLGCEPNMVLDRILRGERAIRPSPFGTSVACPMFAPVADFDAAEHFPDNKTLRLMNRDAQMAVVAARLAMRDAGLTPGELYPAEDIALYGATGLCGMPPAEIAGLLRNAAAADGSLDLKRFGQVALRRIRPVLSFKILANMPVCFVSIFENLRGPNAAYTPWEGQGARAIVAGVQAVAEGDAPCAVVGGCDFKTHALAFLSLQQLGVFDSWQRHGAGTVPGEGAAFLVLEQRAAAVRRGARLYATVRGFSTGSLTPRSTLAEVLLHMLYGLDVSADVGAVLAGDGDPMYSEVEREVMEAVGIRGQREPMRPKSHLGNLFAASAAVQVALAALLARRRQRSPILANCFGHGAEQAAFLLGAP